MMPFNVSIFRRGIGTELHSKAANRLDSIKGMLKDPPKKLGLRKTSAGFEDEAYGGGLHGVVSGTNTAPYNLLTVQAAEGGGGERGGGEHCRGFLPGPFNDRSLRNSVNIIPLRKSRESTSSTFHTQPFR